MGDTNNSEKILKVIDEIVEQKEEQLKNDVATMYVKKFTTYDIATELNIPEQKVLSLIPDIINDYEKTLNVQPIQINFQMGLDYILKDLNTITATLSGKDKFNALKVMHEVWKSKIKFAQDCDMFSSVITPVLTQSKMRDNEKLLKLVEEFETNIKKLSKFENLDDIMIGQFDAIIELGKKIIPENNDYFDELGCMMRDMIIVPKALEILKSFKKSMELEYHLDSKFQNKVVLK